MKRVAFFVFAAFLLLQGATAHCQTPVKVSYCEVAHHPAKYNHQLIQFTTFVSYGFEDFTAFDPNCPHESMMWLEYGGITRSPAMYCCGVTPGTTREKPLEVEGITVPIVDDKNFSQFQKELLTKHGKYISSVVSATLIGRFFSGSPPSKNTFGPGYGHMGCCTLFAIQQVVSVDPQNNPQLDYSDDYDQIETSVGCSVKNYVDWFKPNGELIKHQLSMESPENSWAFTEPQRVAAEAFAKYVKISDVLPSDMKKLREKQGRITYLWKNNVKEKSYMVVVSRPSWLSYYATHSNHVAWVVVSLSESECSSN